MDGWMEFYSPKDKNKSYCENSKMKKNTKSNSKIKICEEQESTNNGKNICKII